jgi:hypothetical protein
MINKPSSKKINVGTRLTFTNSFFRLSSVPRAWFLKITSSSHLSLLLVRPFVDCFGDTYLRLTLKSDLGFNKGLPRAMSCSRAASSAAAFSRSFRVLVSYAEHMAVLGKLVLTSCSLFSALSRLIFSNSRCSSAVSSSSSSLRSYQHLFKENLP